MALLFICFIWKMFLAFEVWRGTKEYNDVNKLNVKGLVEEEDRACQDDQKDFLSFVA